MMKNIFFASVLFFLLFMPQFEALAQSQSTLAQSAAAQDTQAPIVFDMTDLPQWARDLRRFDIIAFGTFPFTMFAVTFITDLIRWNNANGMNFNDLRYAPWPLKSAGAIDMTGEEYGRTILLAAGLSLALALTDFIIIKIRRSNEQRRIESRHSGSFNVNGGSSEDGNEPANHDNEIDESAAADGAFE